MFIVRDVVFNENAETPCLFPKDVAVKKEGELVLLIRQSSEVCLRDNDRDADAAGPANAPDGELVEHVNNGRDADEAGTANAPE